MFMYLCVTIILKRLSFGKMLGDVWNELEGGKVKIKIQFKFK